MTAASAVQPAYAEGQFLGADDLTALLEFARTTMQRQALASHAWGIAAGLPIVLNEIAPGAFRAAVGPGLAIDGYGRLVTLTQPLDVPLDKLQGINTGPVNLWLRYATRAIEGNRAGYGTCDSEDAFGRVEEYSEIEVGERPLVPDRQSGVTVAGATVTDAREAPRAGLPDGPLHCDGSVPYQALPLADEEEDSLWLIPLGIAVWDSVAQSFTEPTPAQELEGRLFRRYFGAVAEDILAADGLIRLRERASPFDPDVSAVCEARAATEADFVQCDGALRARELIWLEGATRLTGDLRLFGTRAEFRDAGGRAAVPHAGLPAAAPLHLERAENAAGGADLRVGLGMGFGAVSRFTVGPVTVGGGDLCDLALTTDPHFVIDDGGRVGIGTGQIPETALEVPLTVRGREGSVTLPDPATGDPTEFPLWPLIRIEDAAGTTQWDLALWTDGEALDLSRPGGAANALQVAADGNVGIGVAEPEARLEVGSVPTAPSGGLGNNLWFRLGDESETGDGGRVWVEYGAQQAPLLVMSDHDNPPRMQFQQTGAGGDEFAPAQATWIGHLDGGQSDFGVIGARRIGLRTENPFTEVTIDGTLGFALGPAPLVQMFPEGVGNLDRMVLSHSPGFSDWGLAYRDVIDAFSFQQDAGDTILHVGLGTRQVGIGTAVPSEALEVRGNIHLGPDGQYSALGTNEDMRAVAGEVSAAGNPVRGSGFTVQPMGTGRYLVTFTPGFAQTPVVTATPVDDIDTAISISAQSASSVVVTCYDTVFHSGEEEGLDDVGFTFIAMGLR